MKHILITNDDGINAPGLIRLAEAAAAFGNVTVVAPLKERSALSHSITIREPVNLYPCDFPVPDVSAWACSGTPSDCVRTALTCLLPDKPDIVLSGINYGWNVASDIQYSATVGAALEAAHQCVPAIAFSEPCDPDHTVTDLYLNDILASMIDEIPGADNILNVNFPFGPCRGILSGRAVSSGSMYETRYRLVEHLPMGGISVTADGIPDRSCLEGTDMRAVLDHYISIGIVRNIG